MNWQDKVYSSLVETQAANESRSSFDLRRNATQRQAAERRKKKAAKKRKVRNPASIHPSKRTPAEQKDYEKRRKAMQAHMDNPYGTEDK
tara:strand:+ start:262 stop:528 length:267 start_codon:yes stop_codon:yes gene_type:complete